VIDRQLGWSRWFEAAGCVDRRRSPTDRDPALASSVARPPIVEDQKLDAYESLEHPAMTTIAACQRQGIKQSGHSLIEDGAIVSTGPCDRAHTPGQLLPTPVGPMTIRF